MKYRLPRLRPGAAPRFHRGDSTGCLVLHGFMASPAEVGWLSDYLAQKHHFTVYTPRLMGHGLAPEHMARMRWQDWYAQALDGYHLLRAQCATVYVVGHSMGGLLALLLAGAEAVEAVVCAAAPLTPPSRRMPYAHWLRLVLPYTQHPTAADL
nr:alpha/beta fold hydrolase [Anaerolineae bacterium]